MPFVPTAMTGLMMAKAASQSIFGSRLLPEVSAVSSAVCTFFSTVPFVTSTNFVTGPGAGTYFGKIIGVIPSAMSSMMVLKAASMGIRGRDMKRLFDAVSFGVCQTLLTTVAVQGTIIGGGPGAGQGKILNLIPSVLQQLIFAKLASKRLIGSKVMAISSAMAFGICNHVMTAGTVMTTCVGGFAPPPAGPIPVIAPGPGRLV